MASEEIARVAQSVIGGSSDARKGSMAEQVVAAVEPLIREQIAKEIERHYLGPDSGRSPLDGREAPDAHLRNAYDEGLEVAVRIARGDHHE